MSLNVNRAVDDQFYRYKMPRLLAKVEGKGNGIKTVIVNMPEIAKSLYRPPMYPTKYFGCELGAQIQYDGKNERYIVNGSHDASKLQDLLDGFIRKFVLCTECDNPETNLRVFARRGIVTTTCTACGNQGMLDAVHRLTTFIIKNPPEDNAGTAGPAKVKKGKEQQQENGDKDHNPDDAGDKKASGSEADVGDDDVWDVDVSEAAVAQRAAELSAAARNMAISDDLEKSTHDRIDLFHTFVTSAKEAESVDAKAIDNEAKRLEIQDKAPMVAAEVLFDENILKQIAAHRNVFLRLCRENPKAQKYLLGAVELLVGKEFRDSLMPKVSNILMALYDKDILEEEVLLEWDQKVSKKYVAKEVSAEIHAKAQKFMEWLKSADYDSDDDSDDEDRVDFTTTGRVGTQVIEDKKPEPAKPTANNNGKAEPQEEAEDDLDIDDI